MQGDREGEVSMKGTIKDDTSRQSGESLNKLTSRRTPRLGPGEKKLIPVAPGPCAERSSINALLKSTYTFRDLSFFGNKISLLVSTTLLILSINSIVKAVPVFETGIEIESSFYNSYFENINSFANESILYRYPWWFNYGINDAVNIDWTKAQDFKYQAIESVLYNFLGGSYEPGSIGCPFPARVEYLIIVQLESDENKTDDELYDSFDEKYIISDIDSYPVSNTGTIQSNYSNFNQPDTTSDNNMNVTPEPSSIIVFTFMAMGYFRMKNRSGGLID